MDRKRLQNVFVLQTNISLDVDDASLFMAEIIIGDMKDAIVLMPIQRFDGEVRVESKYAKADTLPNYGEEIAQRCLGIKKLK